MPHKVEMRIASEYFSQIWDGISSISLPVLDRMTGDPSLTFTLQSLTHRRSVASLSFLYLYYFAFFSGLISGAT